MAEHNDFFQSQMVQDFNREIAKYHLGPLWNAIPDLMNHEPKLLKLTYGSGKRWKPS